MTDDTLVHYYQVTLGPAHLARVRALDSIPGIRCRAIALASSEESRSFENIHSGPGVVDEIVEGVYEETSIIARSIAAIRHFGRTSPDVIIIDAPADPVQFILGRWARWRGCLVLSRWAATVLDHPRRGWKEYLKGFVYRGWDGYLVTGERGLEYLSSFGVDLERAAICGNPVDPDSFSASAAERADRKRGGAGGTFLFVGRFLALKNLVSFVKAFRVYREEGGSFLLRLAGFGETESEVRSIAAGVPEIEFLGHLQLPELVREYRMNDALVLPSYSENWGLVVNEAMHSGLPVIVSQHVGCVPELVRDGESGILFDPLSQASMVAALHRFERLSIEERDALARRAGLVISAHTPEAWGRRVAEVIRDLT